MPDRNLFGKLFLLEFFIDNVEVNNSSLIFEENNNGQLCISFQFLYYPVTEICEEDFTPKTRALAKSSKVIFKSGKSCLFSHHKPQIDQLSMFDLKINVFQKLTNSEGEIYKVPVGTAVVNLGGSFMKLMRNSVDNSDSPLFSLAQDAFVLRDEFDNEIGTILAFIRLSGFGQLIVTQFQMGPEKEYMFKGTDNKMTGGEDKTAEDHHQDVEEHQENAEVLEQGEPEIPGDTPYHELFNYDENKLPPDLMAIDKDGKEKRDPDGKGDAEDDDEEYKEFGAEVNGNSIKIRVLKKKKKLKKSKEGSSTEFDNCVSCCIDEQLNACPPPVLQVCECNPPAPPVQPEIPSNNKSNSFDCSRHCCGVGRNDPRNSANR